MTKTSEMKRKRGWVKWVGVAACVFLLCGWIGSFWSAFGYAGRNVTVDLSVGCFEVGVYPFVLSKQGWFASRMNYEVYWLPKVIHGSFGTLRSTLLFLPLWIPLLLVGAATIVAFRHDRRLAPGHCQTCGYDLSHVKSDTCSECGTPLKRNEQKL